MTFAPLATTSEKISSGRTNASQLFQRRTRPMYTPSPARARMPWAKSQPARAPAATTTRACMRASDRPPRTTPTAAAVPNTTASETTSPPASPTWIRSVTRYGAFGRNASHKPTGSSTIRPRVRTATKAKASGRGCRSATRARNGPAAPPSRRRRREHRSRLRERRRARGADARRHVARRPLFGKGC